MYWIVLLWIHPGRPGPRPGPLPWFTAGQMLEVDRAMVEEFGIPHSLYAIPSLGLDVVPVFAACDIVRIATT